MSENQKNSRVGKFDKRRKNTKSLTIFTILGSVLLVVFIALLVVGGDNEEMAEGSGTNQSEGEQSNHNGKANSDEKQESSSGSSGDSDEQLEDAQQKNDSNNEERQKVKPSDDNVVKAYTGNWQPVGTEQTGPHTINYNEGSQDRIEMRKAISTATDLNSENLIMWWISRNGDQKVVVTTSDANETNTYRVYLTWVKNEGWKPTKVEELKENDQKYRFE
ncbi:YrrS family protein [Virgibacillus ihumii]|uniref:YrrS family protein n=1 Tax=Virgibacillus ihumii TaxID=2686091 RepID=UPI00157CC3CC|nr:YrrS family protein [Virgibacillus ihumii]